MNRKKYFWLLVSITTILAILVCTLPLLQRVKKTIQGVRFVDGEVQNQAITIVLNGFKQNYLFRTDKFNVALTISDVEGDVQTLGPISPENNGMYSITIVHYDPIGNSYSFGSLEFNRDFSILILEGINKSIYVASSETHTNWEEIFQIYVTAPA